MYLRLLHYSPWAVFMDVIICLFRSLCLRYGLHFHTPNFSRLFCLNKNVWSIVDLFRLDNLLRFPLHKVLLCSVILFIVFYSLMVIMVSLCSLHIISYLLPCKWGLSTPLSIRLVVSLFFISVVWGSLIFPAVLFLL